MQLQAGKHADYLSRYNWKCFFRSSAGELFEFPPRLRATEARCNLTAVAGCPPNWVCLRPAGTTVGKPSQYTFTLSYEYIFYNASMSSI